MSDCFACAHDHPMSPSLAAHRDNLGGGEYVNENVEDAGRGRGGRHSFFGTHDSRIR